MIFNFYVFYQFGFHVEVSGVFKIVDACDVCGKCICNCIISLHQIALHNIRVVAC